MEVTLGCYIYSPCSPAVSPEVITHWPELWGMTGSHVLALWACWVHLGSVVIEEGVRQAGLVWKEKPTANNLDSILL